MSAELKKKIENACELMELIQEEASEIFDSKKRKKKNADKRPRKSAKTSKARDKDGNASGLTSGDKGRS